MEIQNTFAGTHLEVKNPLEDFPRGTKGATSPEEVKYLAQVITKSSASFIQKNNFDGTSRREEIMSQVQSLHPIMTEVPFLFAKLAKQ